MEAVPSVACVGPNQGEQGEGRVRGLIGWTGELGE